MVTELGYQRVKREEDFVAGWDDSGDHAEKRWRNLQSTND